MFLYSENVFSIFCPTKGGVTGLFQQWDGVIISLLTVCAFAALCHLLDKNSLCSLRALTAPEYRNCSSFCPPCRLPTRSSERWTWNPRRFFLLREPSGLTSSKALPWWPVAKLRWSKPTTTTPSWSASCARRWGTGAAGCSRLSGEAEHPTSKTSLFCCCDCPALRGPCCETLLYFVLYCISFVALRLFIWSAEKLFKHRSVHSSVVLACEAKVRDSPDLIFWHQNGEFSACTVKYPKKEPTQEGDLTQQSGGRCSVITNSTHRREVMIPISNTDPCTKCFQGFGVGLNIQQRRERSELVQAEPAWPYSSVCSAGAMGSSGTNWNFLVSPSVLQLFYKAHIHLEFLSSVYGILGTGAVRSGQFGCQNLNIWGFLFGYVSWSVNCLFFFLF